jgi:hypothetical protein
MEKSCPICRNEFFTTNARQTFCSKKCSGKHRKETVKNSRVPLSQERLKDLFVLDEATGVLYWRKNHNGIHSGGIAGCLSPTGRWLIGIDGKRHYRYRLVFLYVYGWMPEMIDHKDRNPVNDRPDNLRPCTQSQNSVNSNAPKRKFSGLPRNVIRDKRKHKNPFIARVRVNGRQKHVGSFSTPQEAYAAAAKAIQAFHGEFACAA